VLFTLQVTAVLEVLVTVAVKVSELPGARVTEAGDTLMAITGGGGELPPQPLSNSALNTAVAVKPRFIGVAASAGKYLDAKFLVSVSEKFKKGMSPVVTGNMLARKRPAGVVRLLARAGKSVNTPPNVTFGTAGDV
jgi:hypothetical protein